MKKVLSLWFTSMILLSSTAGLIPQIVSAETAIAESGEELSIEDGLIPESPMNGSAEVSAEDGAESVAETTEIPEPVETVELAETSETPETTNEPEIATLTAAGQLDLSVKVTDYHGDEANAVTLRGENEAPVSVKWRSLQPQVYQMYVQWVDERATAEDVSRKIVIQLPREILVKRSEIIGLTDHKDFSFIRSVTIAEEPQEKVTQINTAWVEKAYLDPTNPNDALNKTYLNGGEITVEVDPTAAYNGFWLQLLSTYDQPNYGYWPGTSQGRLNRQGAAVTTEMIVNQDTAEERREKRILDEVIIDSEPIHSVVVKSEGNLNSPGPQLLDTDMHMIIAPRLRTSEKSDANAFSFNNPSYEFYLPHTATMKDGQYVSAVLDKEKMTAWLQQIAAKNNGKELLTYQTETLADGRVKINFSLMDQTQEFHYQYLEFYIYYRYPKELFAVDDAIKYPAERSVGWALSNFYDGEKVTAVEPIGDNTTKASIVGNEVFDFKFIDEKDKISMNAIRNPAAVNLLGYGQLTNLTTAIGDTEVTYAFDTGNTGNIGVTTVQFWTVDGAYDQNGKTADQYTYDFSFKLQKRGDVTGETVISGTYALTPEEAYKGKTITRNDSVPANLLTYANRRYYYYVNREMLASGLAEGELPVDFDLQDYYIKELSYTLFISAAKAGSYISGDKGRPKEGGGNFFGHTLGKAGSSAVSTMSIKRKGTNIRANEQAMRTFTTNLVTNLSTSHYDVGLFLYSPGSKPGAENSFRVSKIDARNRKTLLTSADQKVAVKEKVAVEARAIASFYPYGATTFAPNPVFYIRTPKALKLNEDSIKLTQNARELQYTVTPMKSLDGKIQKLADGSQMYLVTPIDSEGLGYYNEEREVLGAPIDIYYDMTLGANDVEQTINYKELLFVNDQNFGAGLTGSYLSYMTIDTWGVQEVLPAEWGKLFYYKDKDKPYYHYLATNKYNLSFTTQVPELDFGFENEVAENVKDETQRADAVIESETQDFKATFTMANVHADGYVTDKGMYIAYVPIAKVGIHPEWSKDEPASHSEYSLALKKEVAIYSKENVTYEVGYTTERDKLFNNNQKNFEGSEEYAQYVSFAEVEDQLDQVTMLKIIGRPKGELTIPAGEQMRLDLVLGYEAGGFSSRGEVSDTFAQYTGKEAGYQPYIVQDYVLNNIANRHARTAPLRTVRIRYRPEKAYYDIWAYNENDYPNEDHQLLKTATHKLPDFLNQFTIEVQPFTTNDFYSANLATKGDLLANLDSSVSYGNSTFAFENSFNGGEMVDLGGVLQNNAPASLGRSTKKNNYLSYQAYNANNINDTLDRRTITIRYRSAGSDDIDFQVVLNIMRKATQLQGENALMAGKMYQTFTESPDNIKTTLTDGAFTFQYGVATKGSVGTPTDADLADYYLELSPAAGQSHTKAKAKLAAGGTITMKVQSTKADGQRVVPEYYYYRHEGPPVDQVPLSGFIKMGTNGEKLTRADLDRHISEAEQLSYLFIVDFAEGNTKSHESGEMDQVKLHFPLPISGRASENEGSTFIIGEKRTVSQKDFALSDTTYPAGSLIQLAGSFESESVEGAVDAYNQYKLVTLGVELLDGQGQEMDWPEGAALTVTLKGSQSSQKIYPMAFGKTTRFVVPIRRIDPNDHNSQVISSVADLLAEYQLAIDTSFAPLQAGENYQIRVTGHKNRSSYYPFAGDRLPILGAAEDEVLLPFQITPVAETGLEVLADTHESLVYTRSNDQKIDFAFASQHISSIKAVLKQQAGTIFKEVAWDELLEDEPGTIDPNAGWQLRFKDQLPDRLMGEYTIVFTGYDESGAAEEVYWSFILWKPIEEK